MTSRSQPAALQAFDDGDGGSPIDPRLRWLKVHRYRSVAPGTELTFHEGLHVLLGPHGGGKTALLGLITAVMHGDFRELADEEFSIEYELWGGDETLEVAVSRTRPTTLEGLTPHWWNDDVRATFRRAGGSARRVEASDSRVRVDGEDVTAEGVSATMKGLYQQLWLALRLADEKRTWRPSGRWGTGAVLFDEALSFLAFLRGHGALLGSTLSVVLVRTDATGAVVRQWYHPLLAHAADAITETFERAVVRDLVEVPLAPMGPLGELASLLGMRSGMMQLEVSRREPLGAREPGAPGERFAYERVGFRFERHDGTTVTWERLSHGQKRLVAFAFYLRATRGAALADAPLDGLHPRAVERAMAMLDGRQAFVSTHSATIVDGVRVDSADDARQAFVLCDVELSDGVERLRWRALTAEEARDLSDAQRMGGHRTSDLLRERGLW